MLATIGELSQRLLDRFKDVPNVDIKDTEEWIEMGMNEHGYSRQDNVPTEFIPFVMLYAEADGASQVALRTAYYFEYSDKDESVNKTKVADNYRKLAESLWERYRHKRSEGIGDIGGSRYHQMTRVDRP